MHKVFNDLLTTAILQKLRPCCANPRTFLIVVNQWIVMQVERRAHVDVKTGDASEKYEYNDCVDSICDNGALSQAEVPYLLAHVIWQTKTRFFAHALQAATAPVHGVLGQEEDNGCDNES